MQTKLENPTRYHVIEKQKSQVRQYLSESFQQPGELSSHLQSQCQEGGVMQGPQGPYSHPGAGGGVPCAASQQAHHQQANSYGAGLHAQHGQYLSVQTPHHGHGHGQGHDPTQAQATTPTPVPLAAPAPYTGHNVSPDTAAMSPSLSSVATSTSEVSLLNEYLSVTGNSQTQGQLYGYNKPLGRLVNVIYLQHDSFSYDYIHFRFINFISDFITKR